MRFKLLFLFFILFTFFVSSQPSRGLDLSFNPEAIGFKKRWWIQQHNQ